MNELSPEVQRAVTTAVLALMVITGLIDVALLAAYLRRAPQVAAGLKPPLFARKWSLVDVWIAGQLIVAALIGVFVAVMVLFLGIYVARNGPKAPPDLIARQMHDLMGPLTIGSLLPQNLLLFGVPYCFIRFKYRLTLADVGLPRKQGGAAILRGVGYGVCLLLLGAVLELAIQKLFTGLLGPRAFTSLDAVNKQIGNEQMITESMKSPMLGLFMIIGGGILAPIGEEMFFRGFLFNALKCRLGWVAGMVISGVLFAVVHGGPLLALAIVPFGMILAYVYHRTGSLWVTIFMHITNNGLQLLWLFFHPGTG